MDRYKKKALAFANVEDKRNLRFIRKSIDRSNVRHKRLSELRKLEESTLEEVLDEKTPVKAVTQSEVCGSTQPNSRQKSQILSQQEPKKMTYREKLEKWKEEKELKKQLEARKKIPVFKVGRINSERPPSSVHVAATSKNKEPLKFVPKTTQPSRTALKPPVNGRCIPKPPVGKVASRPVPAVSTVSRSIPNSKDMRTIPTTRKNSRQQPVSNPTAPPTVLSSRPPVKPGNPGTKTPSVGNSNVSSVATCSTSRVVKPPSSNSSAPKQIPKPVAMTTSASKIPNQKTGVVSRIVPPRSCNKQGAPSAKTNASSNSGLRAPQQKKVPAPKGTKVDVEKQTKCDRKDEDLDDIALMDSICEEIESGEKKRPSKSFAPEEFDFKAPDRLREFKFPFDTSNITEMYANLFGISLRKRTPEDKSSSKAESEDQKEDSKVVEGESSKLPEDQKEDSKVVEGESSKLPEDQKEDSKVVEGESSKLPEDQKEDSKVVEGESSKLPENQKEDSKVVEGESSKLPEDQKEGSNVVEFKQEVSQSESLKLSEDKNVAEKEQSVSQAELKDPEVKRDTASNIPAEEGTQREKREKIKDLHLYRQLRTISENSPLPNELDLEDNFTSDKTYKMRRSRRLASNNFAANAPLDPKYFQKTKPISETGSDYLCPVLENPLDSPLTKEFSGLSVDSPSGTKQYNFRVRKPEQENRVSLLGSPVRPHIGPRKSIKGDLICFTP